jgi:hypothetical protein
MLQLVLVSGLLVAGALFYKTIVKKIAKKYYHLFQSYAGNNFNHRNYCLELMCRQNGCHRFIENGP